VGGGNPSLQLTRKVSIRRSGRNSNRIARNRRLLLVDSIYASLACLQVSRYRLLASNKNNEAGRGVTNLSEALRMLGIFASCGAQSFVVTKTELEWKGHKKVKWGKAYSLEALREKLPQMLRTLTSSAPCPCRTGK
jgi:hypothetical protein